MPDDDPNGEDERALIDPRPVCQPSECGVLNGSFEAERTAAPAPGVGPACLQTGARPARRYERQRSAVVCRHSEQFTPGERNHWADSYSNQAGIDDVVMRCEVA